MYPRRDGAWAAVANAPALVLFALFGVFPAAYALYLSLTSVSLASPSVHFVGLDNYLRLFLDGQFMQALGRSGIYAVGTVTLGLAGGLAATGLIDRARSRLVDWVSPIFVVPSILSYVVIAIVWTWIYDPHYGLANTMLQGIGIRGPAWLADPDWALTSVILISAWRDVGYNMIVLLAGLRRIPDEVIENAQIDGAALWQTWMYIRIPLLRPAIAFVVVIQTIRSIHTFSPIYVMTGGGPAGSTTTAVYYLYQRAFESYEIGYGAAVAWGLALLLALFGWAQIRLLRGGEEV